MKSSDRSKNLALLAGSILFGLCLAEVALMGLGRYADLTRQVVGGSNKIWERRPLTSEQSQHPDLGHKIDISFNKFGARAESQNENQLRKVNVGVFGDSFTENRGMNQRFTFTSLLSQASNDIYFHNFGVAGYGIEQSFQNWMEKSSQIPFNVTLYVFCANDLRNIYEAKIFDMEKMRQGIIENISNYHVPWHISILGSLNLTYLFLEAYGKGLTVLKNMSEHRARSRDDFSESLKDDFLGASPSKETKLIVEHFVNVLRKWKQKVEEKGGTFVIIIPPRDVDEKVSRKLLPMEFQRVPLSSLDKIRGLESYPMEFKNDGHWNEYGNLGAAIEVNQYFASRLASLGMKKFSEQFVSDEIKKIDLIYSPR